MNVCRPHIVTTKFLSDMKRKFCLIRTDGCLNVGDVVYQVWAGSSLRESAQFALVEEYCKDVGWYFHLWSAKVDSALALRTKMQSVDGCKTARPYRMISISISECYHTIIDDSWSTLLDNHPMTQAEIRDRLRLNPIYLLNFNAKSCNTSCPPSFRKYLSHRFRSEHVKAGIGVVGIIAIFIIDLIVTKLFGIV